MEWQRWDGKGWERSRDGNTAFDISADCRVQSQSAYRRGNEARTHAVYNIITILVSPLAIFPTWMRDMNQWTAIADVFSFVSNAHSAAHIHRMATGNVFPASPRLQAHSHSYYHFSTNRLSKQQVNMVWASSSSINYNIFFIRTIMICAAILLANFCSHRHFFFVIIARARARLFAPFAII